MGGDILDLGIEEGEEPGRDYVDEEGYAAL
jgi:hypothetical protein